MNFLSRIFGGSPRQMSDAVLGTVTRSEDAWSGRATWPHVSNPFALTIYRKDGVPQPQDGKLYERVRAEYPLLCASIQLSLFKLWGDYRSQTRASWPEFSDAISLWRNLQLQGLGLFEDGHAELIYGFASDQQPDGAFFIAIRGNNVEAIEYVE